MTGANESEKKATQDEKIKKQIDWLFVRYIEHEPADSLKAIAEYLDYLSDRIGYSEIAIDAPADLILAFESISLLLEELITSYPAAIKKQSDHLFQDRGLRTTLATLGNLNRDDLWHMRLVSRYRRQPAILRFFLWPLLQLFFQAPAGLGLTSRTLFDAKTDLLRASQIVKYASTIDNYGSEASFQDFKDQYNPDLIDKNKVLATVNILKIKIASLPDDTIRQRLETNVEEIDKEIRRHRPRWGKIIMGFFFILSVVANLKTLEPNIYQETYDTINIALEVIHRDGQVDIERSPLLIQPEKNLSDGGVEDGSEFGATESAKIFENECPDDM